MKGDTGRHVLNKTPERCIASLVPGLRMSEQVQDILKGQVGQADIPVNNIIRKKCKILQRQLRRLGRKLEKTEYLGW